MSFDLPRAFRDQAEWCRKLDSPFTAQLLDCCAEDIEAGGPLAKAMAKHGEWKASDNPALRLAGALHAGVLAGRSPALAVEYPAQNPQWRMEKAWPAAQAFIARDADWIESFLALAPQTNETRRAIALAPAFHLAGAGPLHMLELGASAGLIQSWDEFAYDAGRWTWGRGPVSVDTQWRGAAPVLRDQIQVASRAGCDASPLDIRDPEQLLRLRAYIWPDMAERLKRFDDAVALANARGVHIDRADAGEWLEAKLAPGLPEGTTIIYHSIAWQYFSPETKRRAEAAIAKAAASATPTRALAWVRFELPGIFGHEGDEFVVDIQSWPGGETRLLAHADPHCRWVEWRD